MDWKTRLPPSSACWIGDYFGKCVIRVGPAEERNPKFDRKILMSLTSHDKLGDPGKKTGFWLEEVADPYDVVLDAGAEVTLASPKGGPPFPSWKRQHSL